VFQTAQPQNATAKRLGFFKDLVPTGVADYGLARLETSEEAARRKVTAQLGIGFESYEIKPTLEDLEAILAKALSDGVDAFCVSGDPVLTYKISVVMPRILATGKPTFGPYPDWARAGLLLTYSTDAVDGFRRAGAYAAKIVQGAKPGDLPIEQASKFWLGGEPQDGKAARDRYSSKRADAGRRSDRVRYDFRYWPF
jgi:putative ABC transport system substrate-binding protein